MKRGFQCLKKNMKNSKWRFFQSISAFFSIWWLNLSPDRWFLFICEVSRQQSGHSFSFQLRDSIVDKLCYNSYQGEIFEINLFSSGPKLYPVKIFCSFTRKNSRRVGKSSVFFTLQGYVWLQNPIKLKSFLEGLN